MTQQIQAIRGAIRVARNDRDAIFRDTQRLLREIERRNELEPDDVVSAFFTMTPDLDADFPAYAAREMGWTRVPMLGAQETPVPGALDQTVRVLLHARTAGPVHHVYLGEAASMRPDLVQPGDAAPDLDASVEVEPEFGPLLVVGLGLIGGSVALAVRRAGRFSAVLGHDVAESVIERARRVGAIGEGATDPGPLLERAEAVLLAIPVGAIGEWLVTWGPRLARGTVVLDTGSAKEGIVRAMEALPAGVEAIAAHPMAGAEESGIGAARPDLFHGARWALVETERTGARARRVARAVVEATGGVPFWTDAGTHDAAAARTSHLPYLLSAALAEHVVRRAATASGDATPGADAVRALVGPGLRDMTRLAASDPELMAEILVANWGRVRAEVRKMIAGLETQLEELEEVLSPEGVPAGTRATRVAEILARAREAQRRLFPPVDAG